MEFLDLDPLPTHFPFRQTSLPGHTKTGRPYDGFTVPWTRDYLRPTPADRYSYRHVRHTGSLSQPTNKGPGLRREG